ncbi:MAG: GNAT family N-acetyltransferase [Acetobacteraceae bacterium]|nr:GNAT family N-acetyltransferase [Acetobacteraceae bacterium]
MVGTLLHSASLVERLLRPRSVAVIGAGTDGRAGAEEPARRVLATLLAGGFGGAVMPVFPGLEAVGGVLAYPSAAALPRAPDLAIVSLPAAEASTALAALAARGAGGAVITGEAPAGLGPGGIGGLRVIGARSGGLIVPALGLNASLCPVMPKPGGIALICHDGGFARTVLDHAAAEGLGFSHVVSLGRNDDLGFTAMLDWLARDGATRVVLLEVGRIKDRRGFLSAARAVARTRPVVALRTAPDERSRAEPADGEAAGADLVFAAALRRAGLVDVAGLEDMLDAATTLSRPRRMRGERVLVVADAPSLGTLAAREATACGAVLAAAGAEAACLSLLLGGEGAENPMIIPPGEPPNRLGEVVACAGAVPDLADAVLAVHAPGRDAENGVAAEALAAAHAALRDIPVIAAWPGGAAAEGGRARLAAAGMPSFASIEAAVRAVSTLIRERRTREAARELPPSTVLAVAPDRDVVRRLLADARAAGRSSLTEDEAAAVLSAYGIPVAPSRVAADAESAAEAAAALGPPVVLKVRSPDLPHKTDVGGVVLDLDSPAAVHAAALAMAARIDRLAPGARREGFLVQRQIGRAGARELFVRLGRDRLFGPAISFGQGGTAAGIAADMAADLPPLNRALAASLVSRTRVARLLAGYRDHPAADLEAIYEALVRLSQLAVDFPDILDADVNPLVAGPAGVVALDAWIAIAPAPLSGTGHLAIAPYPAERIAHVTLRDGQAVTLRPIRPEDADAHAAFFARLTPEDVRLRFFAPIRALSPEQIARMTQIDYDREMAIIASRETEGGAETLGVMRIIREDEDGEFAIVVRSDAKGSGLGSRLMRAGLAWARDAGIRRVVGDVLAENAPMLGFVRSLGFSISRSADDPELMVATLVLAPPPPAG